MSSNRFSRGVSLIRSLASYHPRLFVTAIAGAAVFGVCTVSSSWALRWIIDDVIVVRFDTGEVSSTRVLAGIAVLIGLALVRAVGVVVRRTWAGKAEWRTAESLTGEVVTSLVTQPVTWHRRQSTGDLITRAGVDVEAAVGVMAPLPYSSGVVMMMLVAGVGLVRTDPLLGSLATLVFPTLIAMNVMYQRRVDRWFDLAQDEIGVLSAAVHESFEGVAVVKSFGAEERETQRLAGIASRVKAARFETVLDLVPNAANVALVIGGAYRVRQGHMSVGDVASFIYLFTLLVFPLRLIGFALSEMPRSQAGFSRIRSLVGQPIEPDPATRILRTSRDVVVKDVAVAHDGNFAVEEATFTAARGHLTALVGPTGCGKTSLAHALAGLIPVSKGSIDVGDGECAIVFQEPFLMGASVRDNVTMGAHIDDHRVLESLALAQADFVSELPNGLDTIVGERGVGLSGGQRQRIALARAIVRRPSVLILDDTTSALDPSTEARILHNLRHSITDMTIIAVASRPSLVAMADHVVFMRAGRVEATGTHTDLMSDVDGYRELMAAYETDRTSS